MADALAQEVQELRETVEERRQALHSIRDDMQSMQSSVDLRFQAVENKLNKIDADTGELLEIFHSLKGGFQVLGWLGLFAKWVGGVAGAVYGAWQLYLKYTGR